MGQWFHFGSIHFPSNKCHWLAGAHSMPLVCFHSCPKTHAISSDHFSSTQQCVVLVCVWCCNSTSPTTTVPPSLCSSCVKTPSVTSHLHRNDVVLSQLMDADDANVTLNGFLCMSDVIKSTSKDGGVISTHCHKCTCCVLFDMNVVDLHASHCLFEHP